MGEFLQKKRFEENKEGWVLAKPRKVVAISMEADVMDDAAMVASNWCR